MDFKIIFWRFIEKYTTLKTYVGIVLLALFFVLFFMPVWKNYQESYTNIAKIVKKADRVEIPTISICAGWKRSLMKAYNITPKFMYLPPNESNLPKNATIRSIFSDVTYKLNQDFVIGLIEGGSAIPVPLKIGMNEVQKENTINKYKVIESFTETYGICYSIIPMENFMVPYVDTFSMLIARNVNFWRDESDTVVIQISSKDTYHTILNDIHTLFAATPEVTNTLMVQDFTQKDTDTSYTIVYSEVNTEYIRECSEIEFFKCYAHRIAKSKEYNCKTKCVPLIFQSLMNTIDHNVPRCKTDAEEYCMLGEEAHKITMKLKLTCQKQCHNRGSQLIIRKYKEVNRHRMGSVQIAIDLLMLPEVIFNKEYLIYDVAGMFGSIGGSLGLFTGFSVFGFICWMLKKCKLI